MYMYIYIFIYVYIYIYIYIYNYTIYINTIYVLVQFLRTVIITMYYLFMFMDNE